jgi:hypothetical protein
MQRILLGLCQTKNDGVLFLQGVNVGRLLHGSVAQACCTLNVALK